MENIKTKILLVEDDPNLGTLLQEYLDAKGFETKLADDGKKGFDAFCKKTFDLLLLDVMMPVKDGITLAKEIQVTDKNTPYRDWETDRKSTRLNSSHEIPSRMPSSA